MQESFFEVTKLKDTADKLQTKILEENIWEDKESAQKILRELSFINSKLKVFSDISQKIDDLQVLYELFIEVEDKDTENEIKNQIDSLSIDINELYLTSLFCNEHDDLPAIVSIHSGAGGTESCDWVDMLLRMYLMWAQKQKYTTEVVDITYGEIVGKKNVTFIVRGQYAYGKLKGEKGIHRLVRISPFDANKRRHTTFAGVDVIPEIDSEIKVEISEDDLKIDTFRASGAGGQSVNKTSSAVRVTHIKTGIVVSCQSERSQYQNKQNAITILKSKLHQRLVQEQKQKIEDLRGEQKEIAWGSQIRSYVFHPYNLVKDHRTNVETSNTQNVMDGGIDEFIWEYLKQK